ncbi:MAG: TRAP transporter small permease [Dehalococcoidales bacterium]|nr:TRAP transporter small permease [Dehalococcoidales bacterium]
MSQQSISAILKESPSGFIARAQKWITKISKGAHYCGVLFLAVMMPLTVAHAVGRYGFNSPVPGLVEISSFLLLIGIFLTGAYTMTQKGHIDLGILTEKLSARTQAIIGSVTYFLCFIFIFLAAWQSFARGTTLMNPTLTTSILKTPVYPFLYIMGIGWVLFGLVVLLQTIDFVLKAVKR